MRPSSLQERFSGHGKLVEGGGTYYEGGWRSGLPHGTGTQREASAQEYTGGWEDGRWSGRARTDCLTESLHA